MKFAHIFACRGRKKIFTVEFSHTEKFMYEKAFFEKLLFERTLDI